MKKRTLWLSIFYSVAQISQGLLLHPYQTMQSLVRERVFIGLSLLPIVMLGVVSLIWKYLILAFFPLVLPPVVVAWVVWFCLYWQLLLFYLLVRFWVGFKQ